MAATDVIEKPECNEIITEAPADGDTKAERKPRQTDGGQELLPDMEHFVTLARKIRYRPLLAEWLSRLLSDALPGVEWQHKTCAIYRKSLFTAIASQNGERRHALERGAERILLLAHDYGCDAVKSLLHEGDEAEAAALQEAGDNYGRALYLCVCRLADKNDHRFEQAETIREQLRQSKSETYASHFRGPKGVAIVLDETLKTRLKEAIGRIYPQAPLEEMVVEHFVRRDLSQADRTAGKDEEEAEPIWLHTISVGFNGKEASWEKIIDGVTTFLHDRAVLKITFSYEPATGALSVFTDDKASRIELAKTLRDVVMAGDGEIASMPILHFDLTKFATAEVFDLLKLEPGDGVAGVTINQIKVAREFEQHDNDSFLHLSSKLTVDRDRRDRRNVYTVAYEDYNLDDLTQLTLHQVKLVLRMDKRKDRRAHNVNVQITAPNGLNVNSKTEEERQLVMRLLKRWKIVTEL